MPRKQTLPEPPLRDARTAVEIALDSSTVDARTISEGVNGTFRVELADGDHVVVKTPRYATDEEFLAEPALLSLVDRETSVPVPRIRATLSAEAGPLPAAAYVMAFVDGRQVTDTLGVSAANRERLVGEAATHLAAIQELDVADQYGHLCARDGDLTVKRGFDSWSALFDSLIDDVTAALRGDGALADDDPRFADLAPEIRAAVSEARPTLTEAAPRPAVVTRDYRPANLVLSSDDDDALVRAVIDIGGLTGDGLLDAAVTEASLIDVPLGGTTEAESLRDTFRTAYASARDVDRDPLFDERYPVYRLYAMARRLKAFDYSWQFARETEQAAVAERWRSFAERRLSTIRDGE